MGQVLFSTTILASFLGGIVALLAPCCVSVMLPAFFAASFRRRARIVGMTLVFAAGVATIILPIALGAALISRLLVGYHFWIFSVFGLVMVAVGLATLGGWKFMLPMPVAGRGGKSVGSVYALGVFSGAASACCAPVLAGVAALSGAAASIPAAAVVGVAYVFGMVAPLAVVALLWDRFKWGNATLLTAPRFTMWPGHLRRVSLATLVSGLLMIGMGVLTIVLAVQGPGMAPDGWQVQVTAFLNHQSAALQRLLGVVPGWMFTLAVFAALAAIIWVAVRARAGKPAPEPAAPTQQPDSDAEGRPADGDELPGRQPVPASDGQKGS